MEAHGRSAEQNSNLYRLCNIANSIFFCAYNDTQASIAAHNLLDRFAKLPGLALQIELAIRSCSSL